MVKITINVVTLLLIAVSIGSAGEKTLQQVKTTEQLARFIYQESQKERSLDKYEQYLDDTRAVRLVNSSGSIPIREIYATVIAEVVGDYGWIKGDRKVREICAFTDHDGLVFRYHITEYTEDDYRQIKKLTTSKRTE
jgi:hypothetical protein